jgi:hypothetical protein
MLINERYSLTVPARSLCTDVWHEKRLHWDLGLVSDDRDSIESDLLDDARNSLERIRNPKGMSFAYEKKWRAHVESAVR